MLALCHPFGFLCFYAFFFAHLPTCSCLRLCLLVSSMLQSNGTMDAQSKPTFFLLGHPLLLNNILVFPFIRSICFVCPHLALYVLCSLSLSLVSFVFAYTCMEHEHLEQGCDLLGTSKKGQRCEQEDARPQKEMFTSRACIRVFLSPCTLSFSCSWLGPHSLSMTVSVLRCCSVW